MHRRKLINQLQNYHPTNLDEKKSKEKILDFVIEYKNCFERTLEIGHITASAWLLDKTKSKALLMHHAKLNTWLQLGGHCDGNPDVAEVALKEAQEESGISQIELLNPEIFDIDIHLIPENRREKAHYHYDIRFLLKVVSNEEIIQNSESLALEWFSKTSETLPTNNVSVVRMFEKWKKLYP